MKIRLLIILNVLTLPGIMAQATWIRLSGNRVLLDARIQGIEEDSVIVLKDGKKIFVPIEQMESVIVINEGTIVEKAAIGAGIGLATGALVGALVKTEREQSWAPGTTALYVGILGGFVGSVLGSVGSPELLDLNGETLEQKKQALREFLAPPHN